MPFIFRGLCTLTVSLSDRLGALRQYSRDQLVKVSAALFRSTGSDGGKAQMLALAGPVAGYLVHANKPIRGQLGRLLTGDNCLDDVGSQVGEP